MIYIASGFTGCVKICFITKPGIYARELDVTKRPGFSP